MEIYSINEIIIIHLKRFINKKKIESFVEFPIERLNLTDYLPNKKDDYIYDLFAVANHVGGFYGWHYFGEWYEYYDSYVSKIEKNKFVSDKAYILFYNKRRREKINEEKIFNDLLLTLIIHNQSKNID